MRLTALTFYLLLAGLLCLWTLSAWDGQISWFEKNTEGFRIQEEKYSQQDNLNESDAQHHQLMIRALANYERHLEQSVQIRKTVRWVGFSLLGLAVIIPLVSLKRIKRTALRLADREPERSLYRGVSFGLTLAGLLIFAGAVVLVSWPVGIFKPLYLTDDLKLEVVRFCFFTCLFLWVLTRIYLSRLQTSSETGQGSGCAHASLLLFYILGFLLLMLSTLDLNFIPNFAK